MDADDAADEVEAYRKEHALTDTFDDLLLPALALSETDREKGDLASNRADFVRDTMQDLVDELADQDEPLPSDSIDLGDAGEPLPPARPVSDVRIVLLPANDQADQIAADMLKVLLDRRGYLTTVVDEDALASEKLQTVSAQQADIVVISALPPRATGRARYLVKRLGACGIGKPADGKTDPSLFVGLWTLRGDTGKALARLCGRGVAQAPVQPKGGGTGGLKVITTLADAAEAIRQRATVISARNGEPAPTLPGPT
jgi:hypothetical protein